VSGEAATSWRRARSLFEEAVERPESERADFVAARVADDPALRARVLEMLELDADPARTAFLERPVADSLAARVRGLAEPDEAEALVGTRIGRYELRAVLGRGGMGVVYLAEQTEPVRRQVAIKVVRPGMDSDAVLERFRSEEQALALMQHHNIAAVLDGGVSEDGRPYFVMEYVPGVPLPAYCDTHVLTIEERLRLFVEVCEAVHHAHQKGVIHRDLKASNVLVRVEGEHAVPKVIDFGIARACRPGAPGATLVTDLGRLVGTPEYMSPEQAEASALDVDTRTDVYALGVLLYELVSGRLPFDGKRLRAAGPAGLPRILREEEPAAPSEAARTGGAAAATRRGLPDARALARRLRGDLNAIVARAIAKDRTRRYASASELAADVGRHLDHEPVVAVPGSLPYRASRFVRRHRAVAAAAVLISLVLVAATIVSVGAMREADRAARLSARDASTSRAALAFLRRALASAAPSSALGHAVTIDEALDRASALLDEGAFESSPEAQAAVRLIVGSVFASLGEYGKAELHVSTALLLSREANPGDDPQTMEALAALATIRMERGELGPAIELADEAHAMAVALFGRRSAPATRRMNDLALALAQAGLYDRAEPLFRELLARFPKDRDELARDRATVLTNLSWVRLDMGDLQEAETFAREAVEISERVEPPDHPRRAITYGALARALHVRGKLREAAFVAREALRIDELVHDALYPLVSGSMTLLGRILTDAGELEEAGALLERAVELRERRPDTPALARAEGLLARGLWLLASERTEAAMAELEQAKALYESAPGPRARDVATVRLALAESYLDAGRREEARPLLEQTLRTRAEIFGAEHPWVAAVQVQLARTEAGAGGPEAALAAIAEPLARLERALGRGHPEAARARLLWADWMRRTGRAEQALPEVEATRDQLLRAQGADHPLTLRAAAWGLLPGS